MFEIFFILRIQQDTVVNVDWSSCNVRVFLVRFQLNLNILNRFSKNTQVSKVMKIHPEVAELFSGERRTDRQN
jgi:hypothetical protein